MKIFGIARKTATILANLSLFLNTFLPFTVAFQPVYAQTPEEAASAIVEVSPTPEPSIAAIDPTPQNSPNSEVTPEPTVTPEITPIEELTPEITPEPEAAPVPEVTPAVNPVLPEPDPTVVPTPTPIEKICLSEGQEIIDTVNDNWEINLEEGWSQTKEPVKLGVKYLFPQENKVSITFKCLPKDTTSLKIQKIKISDLKLPEGTNPYGEWAYDITTGMSGGTFEYDITLPKPENQSAEISFMESKDSQPKLVDEGKLNQQGDKIQAENLNHFSIWIATYSANTFSVEKSQYKQGETVYVKASDLDTTKYYRIRINPSGSGSNFDITSCFDPTPDNTILTGSYDLPLDATIGNNWKAELRESTEINCNNSSTKISGTFQVIAGDKPDLIATKSNNVGGNLSIGQTFTWNIHVGNTGTATAAFTNGQEILRDDRPSSVPYGTPLIISSGITGIINCTESDGSDGINRRLTCTANGTVTIPAGAYFDVSFTVTPSSTGTLNNPRTGGSSEKYCRVDQNGVVTEINESNNNCSNNVTVNPARPDLVITKTNNVDGNATINLPFNWVLTITNIGTATATFTNNSTVLTDSLPTSGATYGSPIISYDSDVNGLMNCSVSNNTLNCTTNNLSIPAGKTATVTLPTTPTSMGDLSNPRTGGVCKVDPTSTNGVIIEGNEVNNTCPANTVTVTTIPPVTNPSLSQSCGLDIALVIDNSTSIDTNELNQMKKAMTGFTNALNGTPTQFSVTKFATLASIVQSFTSDVTNINSAINSIPVSGGFTNWQDGLVKAQSTFDPRTDKPNLIIFASDGNPNRTGPNGISVNESQAVADAILVANSLKSSGTRIIALGIGNDLNINNLKAISGSTVGTNLTADVITSDFSALASTLATFAQQTCGHSITVTKLIDGDGSLNTTADQTTASGWVFNIGGTADQTTDNSGKTSAVTLTVGSSYSVVETQQSGYELLSASCNGATQNGTADLANNQITGIQVANDNIISCTFINAPQSGKLIVQKIVNNDYGGDKEASDFSFKVNNNEYTFESDGENEITLDVGTTFNVIENSAIGYTASYSGCSGIITTDTQTCTITNSDIASRLTVIKVVRGGNKIPSDFPLFVDDTQVFSGDINLFSAGTYTVSETSNNDYTASFSDDCNKNGQVSLSLGDNKTCTITNTRKTGKLIAHKFEDKDLDGKQDKNEPGLSGWEMNLYSGSNCKPWNYIRDLDTDFQGNAVFNKLPTGNYSVKEKLQFGWSNTTQLCQNVTVKNNKTGFLNFGNFKYGSISGQKFHDLDGNGVKDAGESGLSGWIINLDKDADGSIDASAVTDANGNYSFADLLPGTYRIREVNQLNWTQSTSDPADIVLKSGSKKKDIDFGNYQTPQVKVYKFNDLNGNGLRDEGEDYLSDWNIIMTPTEGDDHHQLTDTGGFTEFTLPIGKYELSETLQKGWKQTNIYCEDSGFGVKITAPGEAYGHHGNCEGWNGCGNAATCALWACEVKSYTNLVSYGADKPCTQFDNCHLFTSRGNIEYNWGNWCEVRGVTDIVCSNGSGSGNYYNNGYVSGNHFTLNPDQKKICYIGNQLLPPKASISKSNNTGGNQLNPGDSVQYNIVLGFTDNSVTNLQVTDLLSDGFKYQTGSYQVLVNGQDKTGLIPEPQYHSPGTWNLSALGELSPEDQVELIYTADISSDQQAGKFADLAWANADYAYDSSKSLLALADQGYIDTNFVGTLVAVNRNSQNSVSAGIEKIEEISGQVLGASTDQLPATGAATLWLIISSILGFLGLILIKHDKIFKSMAQKVLSIFVLPLFLFLFFVGTVSAASLSVRLEQPKTPDNSKDIKLQFVVLDISGSPVTAKCFKKDPHDAVFTQFGSDISLSAGGNAAACDISSAVNDAGSYQFKVTANGIDSNTVTFDYKNSSPGTPRDYHKENINGNNCDFKIHFKTDNDNGKTVKVELYRSTDSAFSANNDSLVHSVNIGSDQEKDIYNSVPDCSKTYYFALRAFDDAGNGSGLIGDTITVKTIYTDTTITGTPIQGAIPIAGNNISPESNTDGQSPSDNPSDESSQNQSTGQILGSQTQIGNFITNHKIISAVIGLALLTIIIYAFTKIRKSKKGFFRK